MVWSGESSRRDADSPALPGAGDRFFTTWVTLMLPPGAIIAGVNVTVGTFRSGRSTGRVPVSSVLLLSSASSTVALASAVTLILYAPSAVPGGMVTVFVEAGDRAPAIRLTPVRLGPSGISAPLGWGTSEKPTSKLFAAWPPRFFSLYVTLTFIPGAALGTVPADATRRSGPTTIGVAMTFTLLAWPGESVSSTELVGFARAMIQYRPGGVPPATCTLFVSVAIAPPASGPTATSPSTTSPGSSSVALFDKYRRDVDAGAAPAGTARFFTTWVTLTFPPGAIDAGVAGTDGTVGSGCTTGSGTARPLFAPLAW